MVVPGASVSWQRFEYKYLINRAQARLASAIAAAHMVPDIHADALHGNEYPVYSLYFDTRGLRLYGSSVAGEKNRFKLRVRCYEASGGGPAYFEIKSRRGDVVHKQRAAVRRDLAERVAGGFCVVPEDLVEFSPEGFCAVEEFCRLGASLMARPRVWVHYRREAYVDPHGTGARVTLDRHLMCRWTTSPVPEPDGPGWIELPEEWVVLEVKFTDTFPNWAREMVQALDLVRTSMAKYVSAVDTLAEFGYAVA